MGWSYKSHKKETICPKKLAFSPPSWALLFGWNIHSSSKHFPGLPRTRFCLFLFIMPSCHLKSWFFYLPAAPPPDCSLPSSPKFPSASFSRRPHKPKITSLIPSPKAPCFPQLAEAVCTNFGGSAQLYKQACPPSPPLRRPISLQIPPPATLAPCRPHPQQSVVQIIIIASRICMNKIWHLTTSKHFYSTANPITMQQRTANC